jgi:Ca2+-transporting ATPase
MTPPYLLPVEEAALALKTDPRAGLAADEALRRLAEHGPNRLRGSEGIPALSLLCGQFADFIIWVLIGAALVSGFLREWIDAVAIVAIVALNAVMGFVQEYRAEKALAALKRLSSPAAKVVRDGTRRVVPSEELVPGDLIEIEAGDHVPADSRVSWLAGSFAVQEASLTGESIPVAKTVRPLPEPDAPLADRANMVYLGTSVSSGRARALVVATGMATEVGRIAGMLQEIGREATPLQKRLERFGRWLVYACLALVGIVFAAGLLRGEGFVAMFLTAVSLAVAAIPEGLPAVVTIALAVGVQRMVRRHALIRKLPSVETLGCATVICSDKTGTLTRNEMTVQSVWAGGRIFGVTGVGYEPTGTFTLDGEAVDPARHPELRRALACGALCNAAQLAREGDGWRVVGDPTEGAILAAAAKAGIWKERLEEEEPFRDEIPFDPGRKKMTVLREGRAGATAYVKGAPDTLLQDCAFIEAGGAVRPLAPADRDAVLGANAALADRAMRVLGVAYREFGAIPEGGDPGRFEEGLTFAGLLAMIDPPREEARAAVAECARSGIKTVMITGDHKNTAVAVARALGFFHEGSRALTGVELDAVAEGPFREMVEEVAVYARVSPEHKLRIVRAWRARGNVVAMTGDGVNDAPALKEADIGVAMGITGTDVAKEVADMVITDDNFASIVAAVEEGRGIYDNILKFIHYLVSCNTGEILVMFVSSLAGLPLPLLPVQILWVNLVTDGLPALALGMDPPDPGLMERPPRRAGEAVIGRGRGLLMLAQGCFIAACSLAAFVYILRVEGEGIERARTGAFIVLSVSQLFHSFNCRSMTESIFRLGFLTNTRLVLAAIVSFLLQMAVVYLPFLRGVFKTSPLSAHDWCLVLAVSSFPLWAMEAVKLLGRVRGSSPADA